VTNLSKILFIPNSELFKPYLPPYRSTEALLRLLALIFDTHLQKLNERMLRVSQ
jgi:hypothetical protein